MASLKQSMFRSVCEKHCLGRPHFPSSLPFTTQTWVTAKTTNKPKTNKPKKKQRAKKYILILKTKQNQKPSLLDFADERPPPLLTTPMAGFSLPTVSHSASRKTHPLKKTRASLGASPKLTRAIQLRFLPPPPPLRLLFASLPVVQQLFSWYQQVRRQGV